MTQLSLTQAHNYVLQVLDEITSTDETPMLNGSEDFDTLKLTEGYLPEAIIKAHKDAPSFVVDGVVGEEGADYEVNWLDKVGHLRMLTEAIRVVSVKAEDSPVVVSDYSTEDSPIGRMQNNKYVRGAYDDPRLIVKKVWANDRQPEFYYYTAKEASTTLQVEFIPYPTDSSNADIADKLEYAILNLTASMVLDALSLHDKAVLYKNKYQEYLSASR